MAAQRRLHCTPTPRQPASSARDGIKPRLNQAGSLASAAPSPRLSPSNATDRAPQQQRPRSRSSRGRWHGGDTTAALIHPTPHSAAELQQEPAALEGTAEDTATRGAPQGRQDTRTRGAEQIKAPCQKGTMVQTAQQHIQPNSTTQPNSHSPTDHKDFLHSNNRTSLLLRGPQDQPRMTYHSAEKRLLCRPCLNPRAQEKLHCKDSVFFVSRSSR